MENDGLDLSCSNPVSNVWKCFWPEQGSRFYEILLGLGETQIFWKNVPSPTENTLWNVANDSWVVVTCAVTLETFHASNLLVISSVGSKGCSTFGENWEIFLGKPQSENQQILVAIWPKLVQKIPCDLFYPFLVSKHETRASMKNYIFASRFSWICPKDGKFYFDKFKNRMRKYFRIKHRFWAIWMFAIIVGWFLLNVDLWLEQQSRSNKFSCT